MLIPLTKGKTAIIDDEDYELVSKYSWSATKSGNRWYAKATIRKGEKQTTIRMHRLIMGVTNPKQLVDHEKGNGLDNRKSNLRKTNHLGNARNSKKQEGTSSIYKGVTLKGGEKPFLSRITIKGKTKLIGSFKTEIEAAMAYDNEAREHFGSFAQTNF